MSVPFHITIVGKPVTKKNSGRIGRTRSGRPFVLPSAPYVKWRDQSHLQARRQWFAMFGRTLAAPCSVAVTVYRARRTGDLDNFLSAAGDLLQYAGVIKNDRLIRSWDGSRLECDPTNPRVEMLITPLPEVTP
jgi:Holliday junction resolvase RusA-like endonuclease